CPRSSSWRRPSSFSLLERTGMQPIPDAVLAALGTSAVPVGPLTPTRGHGALGSNSATTLPLYENRAWMRTLHPVRDRERHWAMAGAAPRGHDDTIRGPMVTARFSKSS